MLSHRQKFPSQISNENGLILLTTIMLMVVMAALVFVGTQWAQIDIGKTKKYTKSRDSFYTAEAGIQRAINFFNFDPVTGSCPGEVENGFQDELTGGNWPSSFNNTTYQGGEYSVSITDNIDESPSTDLDLDNTVVLKSVGTKRGVSTTIEATIYRPLFTPRNGIITEDKLTGDGGFTVDGTNGLVHTNSNFEQNGTGTEATQGTTANNDCCLCEGDSCLAEQNIGKIDLPAPNVEFFRPFADFVLRGDGAFIDINTKDADGEVISTETLVYHTVGLDSCWKPTTSIGITALEGGDCTLATDPNHSYYLDWGSIEQKINSGRITWKVTSSDNPPDGIYFVEGSFTATGSSSTPWKVTIISTANIDLAGSREYENYSSGSYGQVINDAFLIADRDMQIGGSVSVDTRGFFHARDQVNLAGTVKLKGWIVAAGIYPSPFTGNPPLPEGKGLITENTISGNVHITYDDLIGSSNPACVVKVLAWREIAGIG